MQRGEVERLAAQPSGVAHAGMHNPAEFLETAALDDLRDEEGNIDAAKVDERLSSLHQDRPHLFKPVEWPDFGQGVTGTRVPGPATWSDALKSE